jgi:CRP/FNR family transcriptional regulator, cyclic AMP receptor protein
VHPCVSLGACLVKLLVKLKDHLIVGGCLGGLRLVRDLAQRLHASEARYADVIGKDVPARLAALILTLVDSEGLVTNESYRIPTSYTHEQLASMIGCKRVAVTRAFSRLKEVGAVEIRERHILVEDLGALTDLAESA